MHHELPEFANFTQHDMNLDPVILSIPIFFVLIGLELVYDAYQRRKKGQGVYRLNDAFANISCGIIDQATAVFAKVFTVGAYVLVFSLFENITPWTLPSNWLFYILCFVAVDFAYYWAHRWSHQVNLFWTGHVVHHQSEEYNLSVALRQGAFQKVLMFWVYLPLAVVGFPPEWIVVSMGLNLLYQFWIHTEAVDKMGVFEWVMNTPSHHRVHHGRNPKYIDKNHAGVFIIWDRMFGTFQKEEERPTYGITRPLNTFNPVMAHVQPFRDLWQDVRSIPSFKDKVRFLFAPPGWYPESMGGFKAPPEISGSEEKFNQTLPLGLNIYLLVQYFFVVGIAAFFLFGLERYNTLEKGIFLSFLLYQVFGLGSIFDRNRKALVLEGVRTGMLFAFAVWSGLLANDGDTVFGGAVMVISLLSAAWLAILVSRKTWYAK